MERQHLSQRKNAIAPPQTQSHTSDRNSSHPIEELLGAIGNRAVNQLLANQPTVQAKPMFRGLSGELRSPIQPKLTIGAPADKYEQEADRVAEQVVSQINKPENSAIQRQETLEEDEDIKLRMKPMVECLSDGNGITATPDLEASIQQVKGNGQTLPTTIRQPIEQALSADFRDVKIHTDLRSDRLNQSIQSQAFTTGKDIFFRQGTYQPGSRRGQELLAHELTHVLQQNSDVVQQRTPDKRSVVNQLQCKSTGIIQRVIAMTPAVVTGIVPPGHALQANLTQIGNLITQYNTAATNGLLTPAARTQQQFDLLRQIDREIYHCMDTISQGNLELDTHPIAQVLHTLHSQTQAEHEDLVETITQTTPALIHAVNPLDTTNITDMTPDNARLLWHSIMTGLGKIKLVGDAAYNRKVRYWLTKLMDTEHGRELLNYLNSHNVARGQGYANLLSNIYIGRDINDLPAPTRVAADPGLTINPDISQATPLALANTSLDLNTRVGGNFLVANNQIDFKDAVIAGNNGVTVNGQNYRFGQGTGSFVHVESTAAAMPTLAGRERMGIAGIEMPQVYTPEWITLGHELGHAANMRAGAGTENFVNQHHGVFADRWSGKHGQELEDFWYHGSEEFLNIENIENPIRQDVGLSERGAHSTPEGVMRRRRYAQILIDLNLNANRTYLNSLADGPVKTSLWMNGLEAVHNHIRGIINATPRTPNFLALCQMAQRMAQFITDWQALQNAYANASRTKKVAYYAQWNKAQSSVHNIGTVVTNNDMVTYNRKLLRIKKLTNNY